jgi:ABC-type transporter Mla MlaB component
VTQRMFDIVVRTLSDRPPAALAEVSGEIDVTSATEFTSAIHASTEVDPLIVDLTRLTYIDSAGFAALDYLLHKRAITIVINPRSLIHGAAKLVALPCYDTIADAQQAAHSASQ